jgi:hypothetical protein
VKFRLMTLVGVLAFCGINDDVEWWIKERSWFIL